MDPAGLKFTKTHEWLSVDGDIVTIGISDFAVQQLTDLVYVDLPVVGRTLSPGDVFGEVESVKAVSDLYSPVGGTVVEANETLPDNLDLLSSEPLGKGWLVKMKVSKPVPLDDFMDEEQYRAHCAAESH